MVTFVLGIEFDNAGHLLSRINEIRYEYPCNKKLDVTSNHGRFILDLLRRHPHWPCRFISGVTAIRTGRLNTRSQNGFCWVDRTGTSILLSSNACAHGRSPGQFRLSAACAVAATREARREFMVENKEFMHDPKTCDLCQYDGPKLLPSYLPPRTLSTLWKRFRVLNPELDYTPGSQGFISEDTGALWRSSHRRNAVLRALCARCYYQQAENKT